MSEKKDYYIEKIEKPEQVVKDTNGKIALNATFAISGFILAGVAFGIGEELFASTTIQTLAAFGGVGITSASLKGLRDNIKLKSTAKKQMKGSSK